MPMIEETLREYIIREYGSLREFSIRVNIPYSTLYSMLQTGISKARIENVLKICSALHIDADALTSGKIVPVKTETTSHDLEERVTTFLNWIRTDDAIRFRGEKADPQMIQYVEAALEIGLKLARKVYSDD